MSTATAVAPAKILAVDDEPDFELLIRQRFRHQVRAGEFAFRFAHHGEEALKMLEADPDIEVYPADHVYHNKYGYWEVTGQ